MLLNSFKFALYDAPEISYLLPDVSAVLLNTQDGLVMLHQYCAGDQNAHH